MPTVAQVVAMDADGRVSVQVGGPVASNKAILVGLLELAKQAILAPAQQPAGPQLLVARGPLPNGHGG